MDQEGTVMQPTVFPCFTWKSWLKPVFSLIALIMLTLQLMALPAYATSVQEIPRPTSEEPLWVVDEGEVLSRITEGALNKNLSNFAQDSGNELHVITIHRLDYGETTESFAQTLLERWFPDVDVRANRAVLVLDTVTSNASLAAGDRIETTLTEEIATSVVDETLGIPLRQGRYNQALQAASDRLLAVLSGQPDPGPPKVIENVNVEGTYATAEETEMNRANSTVWVIGLLVAATVIPMATYYLYLFLQSRA
jgi:uncharacterized protein